MNRLGIGVIPVASCKIITQKGKNLICVDVANAQPHETIAILGEARKVISSMPPKSALILTDVTNAVYNLRSSNAIKAFSLDNSPFVKASAVVGADGIRAIALRVVMAITRREIMSFRNREEAIGWLASQS